MVAKVEHPMYKKSVFLKTLPTGNQLWGDASRQILDAGIEASNKNCCLSWSSDPTHENGGYFTPFTRDCNLRPEGYHIFTGYLGSN